MTTEERAATVGGVIAPGKRRRFRPAPWFAWLVVLPLAAWTVVRLGGFETGGIGIQLMAATPYATVAALIATGLAVLARNRIAAVVGLASTVALAAVVLPRAFGSAQPAASGPTLKILSINMRFGGADATTIVNLVRTLHPDILNTQELSPWGVQHLQEAGLSELMPYDDLAPERSAAGSGIFARVPLTTLPDMGLIEGHHMPHVRFTMPGGRQVELVDVHTVAPLGPDASVWSAAMRVLPEPEAGTIRILAGDYNATLDHAEFRRVLAKGYVDVGDAAGIGLVPTWPAGRSIPPVITIDHVLVDPRVAVVSAGVHSVPRTDHRALFAELRLP
ncbi:endonuclease/exonuclease/phosphatase family protein [Streptosporangiaceae bacterium NEAU-GS5]|nr:endonuclease/exonuclease/phosphatase family protein [Streptosporangiaceae bacterium NEAU-GS5]